jgi:hypothetical protein
LEEWESMRRIEREHGNRDPAASWYVDGLVAEEGHEPLLGNKDEDGHAFYAGWGLELNEVGPHLPARVNLPRGGQGNRPQNARQDAGSGGTLLGRQFRGMGCGGRARPRQLSVISPHHRAAGLRGFGLLYTGGLMAERIAKVAGGHVTVGERVRMRWGAKWAGVVRSISERTPTSGVVYVRVDTDPGPTLEDSALAWEKEG